MRFTLLLTLFVSVVHTTLVQSQFLSRLLSHFLFSSRHSDEEGYPRYGHRRPPPRRRYHRRPSNPSDPFKYDPDDEDYYREHALPRPPRRPSPSYQRTYVYNLPPPQSSHKSNEQDGDDNHPPMTIYLQAGANGDYNKPRRIRVVTLDSYPHFHREFGYGHNNPYQTGLWNKGFIQRDIIFPQNYHSSSDNKRGLHAYGATYGSGGYPEPTLGHIFNGFGDSDDAIDSYGESLKGGNSVGSGGTVIVPDPAYHSVNTGYTASRHGGIADEKSSFDAHAQSTTVAAKFDYDYYRKKRRK
ncbi:uncharacterized protein LOC111263115 isoform X2 [Varroa jacobsoni]|uniref:Uncharacterized protein n=1 Tax=Varroa destructor TaxID=109461 RepID=A0A7M7K6F1_VARDE|nr:uncharacterized protein LOC111250816 isoform X2 [Varroa destructor]XP_022693683.1 uncharacterized protein LOC111263115 isoform X2 [Varroa jacobsoni]